MSVLEMTFLLALVCIEKCLIGFEEFPQPEIKAATIMIFNTLSKCMRLFLFLAIYLFMFTKKNPKKIIKKLYL